MEDFGDKRLKMEKHQLKETPEITVGVSTFNRKDYLRESLESLQNQTFHDFEIIVVDDGSTDGTREMIRRDFPGIRYLYQENQGDAAAKNKVAAHARGRYLVFNDSDDLFLPDALERLYAPLVNDPDGCSYGQYITIDSAGNRLPTKNKMKIFPSGNILPDLILHIIVHSCATLMPLKLFRQIGGHDITLLCGHDYKLALELAVRTGFHAIEKPVFLRRRHSTNLSSTNYEKMSLILKVLNEFLEKYPDVRGKYGAAIRKRFAALHGKLAREAKKELLPRTTVRRHLKAALHETFSLKSLCRYVISFF